MPSLLQILPRFAPELFSPDQLVAITPAVRALEPVLRTAVGIECHLAGFETGPDIAIQVARSLQTADLLVTLAGAGIVEQRSSWDRLVAFLSDVRSGDLLPRDLWLEFDLPGTDGLLPTPAVFLDLRLPPGESNPDRFFQILRRVIAIASRLRGEPPDAATQSCLASVFRMLPCAVEVVQFGMFPARSYDFLRLGIFDIASDALCGVLSSIGWSGDLDPLASVLSALGADNLCLHVDVSSRIGPRIGVECYLSEIDTHGRWGSVLDVLCARSLCSAVERENLLCFPGVTESTSCTDLLPGGILEPMGPPSGRRIVRIHRSIHHIKVCHNADASLRAKAYLLIHYERSPRGE
jgi:hypothetical protein